MFEFAYTIRVTSIYRIQIDVTMRPMVFPGSILFRLRGGGAGRIRIDRDEPLRDFLIV
jgi:hypothetical protein